MLRVLRIPDRLSKKGFGNGRRLKPICMKEVK